MDPFIIVHSKSTFSDHQTLKLQEAPDMVPVGELPRHMLLSADRYLTGQVVPGSRVIATGVYSTFQSSKNVRYATSPGSSAYTFTPHRNLPAHPHSEHHIFASSTLRCLHHQHRAQAAPTPLAYSSRPKRRKSLARWRGARASMSDSLKA